MNPKFENKGTVDDGAKGGLKIFGDIGGDKSLGPAASSVA